jgi:hypothetical protein
LQCCVIAVGGKFASQDSHPVGFMQRNVDEPPWRRLDPHCSLLLPAVQSPLDNSASYDLCILERNKVRAQLSISPFHQGDFGREPFVLSVLERITAKNELSRGELPRGDRTWLVVKALPAQWCDARVLDPICWCQKIVGIVLTRFMFPACAAFLCCSQCLTRTLSVAQEEITYEV